MDQELLEVAKLSGNWSDIRAVKVFGSTKLVLKGQKHFTNAGIRVSTSEVLTWENVMTPVLLK